MRYLSPHLPSDLNKKMVFLSGPRQVGKTHLAATFMKDGDLYLNWDDPDHRKRLRSRDWPDSSMLLVFDEIHKLAPWRNWLKGTYDTQRGKHRFIVTGSARLDIYRRGGDSLLGRYHHWRLHPFCLSEAKHTLRNEDLDSVLEKLMSRGGFPEPYLGENETQAKRWRKERRQLILREDLRDLERVREISQIGLLLDLLAERVSGPVVMANLAVDLDVKPKTVKYWLGILERLYLGFLIYPFTGKLVRAIKKTPKFYFYDNGEVPVSDPGGLGPRFENLVASHLLKKIQFLEDLQGDAYSLHCLRDKEDHEVDFVIVKNRKPIALIEAKWSQQRVSPSLNYFGDRLNIKNRIQIVRELSRSFTQNDVRVFPATEWLSRPLEGSFYP